MSQNFMRDPLQAPKYNAIYAQGPKKRSNTAEFQRTYQPKSARKHYKSREFQPKKALARGTKIVVVLKKHLYAAQYHASSHKMRSNTARFRRVFPAKNNIAKCIKRGVVLPRAPAKHNIAKCIKRGVMLLSATGKAQYRCVHQVRRNILSISSVSNKGDIAK